MTIICPQTMWRPVPLSVPPLLCMVRCTCASAAWLCLCSTIRTTIILRSARASSSPRAMTSPSWPPVLMVNEVRIAAEQLAAEGIHARSSTCTIKPLDEELVLKAAAECGKVITAEGAQRHRRPGRGCLRSAERSCHPVRRIGVQDEFGCSGPAWDLLHAYGLDAATIVKTTHEMLGR